MRWVLRRGVAARLDADIDPAAFAAFLGVFGSIFAAHRAAFAFLFDEGCRIDAMAFAFGVAMADGRAVVGGRAIPGGFALRRVGAGSFYARNRSHSSTVTHRG